jgi:hypothetical protein
MIETLIASLTDGSLFSQYHSGIVVNIFTDGPHSHIGAFALAFHRSLIFSKSLFPGINEDNVI